MLKKKSSCHNFDPLLSVDPWLFFNSTVAADGTLEWDSWVAQIIRECLLKSIVSRIFVNTEQHWFMKVFMITLWNKKIHIDQ